VAMRAPFRVTGLRRGQAEDEHERGGALVLRGHARDLERAEGRRGAALHERRDRAVVGDGELAVVHHAPMATDVLVLSYAACGTCKKALRWLDDHDVAHRVRPIVDEPPTRAELATWIARSGLPVRKWLNTSGQSYRALGKAKIDAAADADLVDWLSKDGKLVKRPVLVAADRVLIGFAPDAYAQLTSARERSVPTEGWSARTRERSVPTEGWSARTRERSVPTEGWSASTREGSRARRLGYPDL